MLNSYVNRWWINLVERRSSKISTRLAFVLSFLLIAVVFGLILFFMPPLQLGIIACEGNCADDISVAASLGRLDIVSLALGTLGIGVGFFAIFGFFAIKDDALRTAERVAQDIVRQEVTRQLDLEITKLEARKAVLASSVEPPEIINAEEV